MGGTQRRASSRRFVDVLGSSAGGPGLFKTMPATGSPSRKVAAAIKVWSVWLIVPRALRATIRARARDLLG